MSTAHPVRREKLAAEIVTLNREKSGYAALSHEHHPNVVERPRTACDAVDAPSLVQYGQIDASGV